MNEENTLYDDLDHALLRGQILTGKVCPVPNGKESLEHALGKICNLINVMSDKIEELEKKQQDKTKESGIII